MEQRLEIIEKEIELIKSRNKKVEENKSWETSYFRVISICLLTYIVISIFLYFIGVPNFLASAIIPVVGFFISTRSLAFIKDWWIKRNKTN